MQSEVFQTRILMSAIYFELHQGWINGQIHDRTSIVKEQWYNLARRFQGIHSKIILVLLYV